MVNDLLPERAKPAEIAELSLPGDANAPAAVNPAELRPP